MTARSPVRTTRPIRYSLLWYSLAVSTKLTPMVERASDLRTGGSQRLRGIAWLNPKSKSPSEKFAVRYTLAHHLGQNQEPSFDGLNRHGKLRYSWAVDLGPFKIASITTSVQGGMWDDARMAARRLAWERLARSLLSCVSSSHRSNSVGPNRSRGSISRTTR